MACGEDSHQDMEYLQRDVREEISKTHFYDDLVDLLIKLAMERENDSHMDKDLRKHLRRETPAEKSRKMSLISALIVLMKSCRL